MIPFKEMAVWTKARTLVRTIYVVTDQFPRRENYGITSQIRRSAVSIPSNIAEGVGRYTPKEAIYFIGVARGSLFELETQLYLSNDLSYLSNDELEELISQISELKMIINGLSRYHSRKTKL